MDIIMAFGVGVFFILFAFLLFLFSIFVIGRFRKQKTSFFEPSVAVVIPAYNEEKSIRQCIESVRNSNYPPEKIEIVIVDDGSTDKTVEIAESMNARVLKQNHLGKVDALNYGSKEAKADFIVTIDADTVVGKDFIKEMLLPFADETVGATSGAVKVLNNKSLLGIFQNIEYHNNNLIRNSFSRVFSSGIWFFGSLACYRKLTLEKIGFFKKDTVSEDMDVAMEVKKADYKTINIEKAEGYTIVPETFKGLLRQRRRWWVGGLQSLMKNKSTFLKGDPAIKFLFINQFWWSFYAWLSTPLFIYQIWYWYPHTGFMSVFWYFFRWFSITGPFYVLYKMPEWGFSFYNIFGVLSGIISLIMVMFAVKIFHDKFTLRNIFAIFFYFPYTILLNIIVCLSLITFKSEKKHFIK